MIWFICQCIRFLFRIRSNLCHTWWFIHREGSSLFAPSKYSIQFFMRFFLFIYRWEKKKEKRNSQLLDFLNLQIMCISLWVRMLLALGNWRNVAVFFSFFYFWSSFLNRISFSLLSRPDYTSDGLRAQNFSNKHKLILRVVFICLKFCLVAKYVYVLLLYYNTISFDIIRSLV